MSSSGGRVETHPLTAEAEAVKRNTDCIYFLASPSTCKKGSECEYRHSEGARLNPRDCYYWLNSNCLNPKCSFRHPLLDTLFGPLGTLSGLALPPSLTVPSKQIPTAHGPAYPVPKQSSRCVYFQKGQCLKGDRCPFSHGQPQACKEDMALEAPVSSIGPIIQAEASPSNGLSRTKNSVPHPSVNKLPRSQSVHASVINSNAWSRTQNHQIHPSDEHLLNGMEPGEIIGEYSSGFDSRIDNINIESRGDYGRLSAQSGRKPDHSFLRNQRSNSACEVKHNVTAQDYHVMKPHKISSERNLDRHRLPERRVQQSCRSPDEVNRVDLRHRLKRRKMDEFRSTVSSDRGEPHRREDDRYKEDKYRGHNVESSMSTRLRGRINLPETSERDAVQLRGKRSREDLGGRMTKREDADSLNFTGPKSLTELKGSKLVGKQDRSTKSAIDAIYHVKNNDMVGKVVDRQELEATTSFEGPKPLSILLKRKREENNQRSEGVIAVCAEEVKPSSVLESNNEDGDLGAAEAETGEEMEDLIPSRDELISDGKSDEDYVEDVVTEDQEFRILEQGGGESDYEAIDTDNFKTECESQGEEDDELDDEEDFARKVGLILS